MSAAHVVIGEMVSGCCAVGKRGFGDFLGPEAQVTLELERGPLSPAETFVRCWGEGRLSLMEFVGKGIERTWSRALDVKSLCAHRSAWPTSCVVAGTVLGPLATALWGLL